ncbi:hypothetical protein [Harryflintia acetispora]|uniref:hypothetical protein n=1 Tax=Harryflintia acetispora TaxID=1849041 RepID=UPI00189B5209|nr:hypothetical protein [Harryflintia acetispora]
MSLRASVIKTIQELFDSQGILTIAEVRERLKESGVNISPNSTIIRSTIYQLKEKDSRIRREGRGAYRLVSENGEFVNEKLDKKAIATQNIVSDATGEITSVENDNVISYLNRTEKEVITILSQIEKFKWLQCTEAEVILMRKRCARVQELYETIGLKLQKLH